MNHKQRNWIIGVVGLGVILGIGYLLVRISLVCCALPPTPPTLTAMATILTRNANLEVNGTTEGLLQQTQTSTFQTAISLVFTPTPTSYPYDPTLYAQRRHEEQILQTAAGPTEYAQFFATETALVATYQGTVLPTSTPIPYTADMSPTVTPTPRPIRTATALAITPSLSPTSSVHDSNCAFSWAHQDLPEIAKAADEALRVVSVARFQVVRVDAYGENCNRADGSLSYFAAMTTDFYLSVEVADLNDAHQLAQIVKVAYTFLTELKVKLPAEAGYLDIVFTAGEQQKRFRAMFGQIKPLIEGGKSETELLAAGKM